MPNPSLLRAIFPVALSAAGAAMAMARGEELPALAFAVAFALGHVFPLRTGSGRLQPQSPAIATGAALLVTLTPALWGAAIGLPLGWLVARVRFGERAAADLLPGEAVGMGVFTAVFVGLDSVIPGTGSPWADLACVVPAAAAWVVASSAATTGWTETRRRFAAGLLWKAALRDWPAYLVLVAAGSLFAEAWEPMGWWAALFAALPYAFSHLAFTRLATARNTYHQTIRALGRVPEAGGFVMSGHAERSADIAVAMGAELRMSPRETGRLEQAALLADIGRVVLAGPGFASGGGYTTRDLAQWSAAIVAEAPSLQPAAAIVGDSYRPYRRAGEARDRSLPPPCQVVKVATAYDYAIGGGMEPVDALEILHRGVAYDYDPEVVAALRRVLQRRGCPGV